MTLSQFDLSRYRSECDSMCFFIMCHCVFVRVCHWVDVCVRGWYCPKKICVKSIWWISKCILKAIAKAAILSSGCHAHIERQMKYAGFIKMPTLWPGGMYWVYLCLVTHQHQSLMVAEDIWHPNAAHTDANLWLRVFYQNLWCVRALKVHLNPNAPGKRLKVHQQMSNCQECVFL